MGSAHGSAVKSVKFGVLLPITSRGLPNEERCILNLENFAASLKETALDQNEMCKCGSGLCSRNYVLKIYLGVDLSDSFLSQSRRVEIVFGECGIFNVEKMALGHPPGSICAIWRDLARRAYEDDCHYTMLLGDDVVLKTAGWMCRFDVAFRELESKRGVPWGFGCVSFADRSFPGFPTFPVLGRSHFEIFAGEVLPHDYINQDGDPYLFQLYRRWGCSVMLQDVFLENSIGGSCQPRYEKKHVCDWRFDVLDRGIETVRSWLTQTQTRLQDPPRELLTLDIVVPSFRVPLGGIDAIVNLKRSETASTMVIIIVDDPLSPNISELKRRYEHDPLIRIRVSETNAGASAARNRGLAESAADYVLFLDDDVLADQCILLESEKVIRKSPKACGFVGNSRFPDPTTSLATSAIVLSGVTFFWGITSLITEDVPWGVTANLIVRRSKDNVFFDLRFPKTGGGEDIDYCIRKRDWHVKSVDGGEGFRGAPGVVITHPWWNGGGRSYNRFRRWGIGDGALVKLYPRFTYCDSAPNSAETFLLVVVMSTITIACTALLYQFGAGCYSRSGLRLVGLLLSSAPGIFLANVLYDVRLHCYTAGNVYIPELRGRRRLFAAAESSLVRMVSELGRLEGTLRRKEWNSIGRRFDWFAGRLGNAPMQTERTQTFGRFLVWLGLSITSGAILFHNSDMIC